VDERSLKVLIGKTMRSVEKSAADRLVFTADDGREFVFFHSQDCCESVDIHDINGELSDLVGAPITQADEEISEKVPADVTLDYAPESWTWTFYKFATNRGAVTVRWYGHSNGYYSESVSFAEVGSA
jgi:hypothetical protein